jgi:hypothetical protein
MRTISWTEFKKTKLDEMRKRESVIVTGDGEEIFIAIIGAEGNMHNTITSNASIIQAGKKAGSWT